ncbi:Mariner Mos1 transposase [Eumeta japonica]|uniref:Mariner Mos1 transposase n=1 Tax=Eumeta variegata TaxID=151549 RepID=A0A4C1VG93_EUMVA|nr:Mariner Mos1 transposase [Eumeta japonica]
MEKDSSQTQKELALTLEVYQQAVSHRLKSLGIIHKQGSWVPYELKGIKGLPYPPYSPDIAPSDYHLFWSMAHALSEQRFTSYEDTKNWVDLWIASKDITCRDWFRRFKNNDFELEDKERSGAPEKFQDKKLEELLNQNRCQTLTELRKTLQVNESTVSEHLKVLEIIQKQGLWVPYELKLRDVERCFLTCELLLQRQKRKGFLHPIVTGDEKGIHYDYPKRKKSWGKPSHASTSCAKPNIHGAKLLLCIWWDQQGVIYYELLKPNEIITADHYQLQLMRLSRS